LYGFLRERGQTTDQQQNQNLNLFHIISSKNPPQSHTKDHEGEINTWSG
jgi:hypothetical protein